MSAWVSMVLVAGEDESESKTSGLLLCGIETPFPVLSLHSDVFPFLGPCLAPEHAVRGRGALFRALTLLRLGCAIRKRRRFRPVSPLPSLYIAQSPQTSLPPPIDLNPPADIPTIQTLSPQTRSTVTKFRRYHIPAHRPCRSPTTDT
jgi:hypothetical protein